MGWHLCALAPRSKRPIGEAWQIRTREAEWWHEHPEHGVGLVHGPSGTCALDVDDYAACDRMLRAAGIDLSSLLARGLQIVSREGRAKVLYRLPAGVEMRTHQVRTVAGVAYELRAGAAQDVLPPSIHPDTGRPYQWLGDPWEIDEIPAALLEHWRSLDSPRAAVRAERRLYDSGAGIIGEFNRRADVGRILEDAGYLPCGSRWLSPHSTSGMPGVVLLPPEEGEPDRVYCHHGSDPLADGHAHDAFGLYCTLVHRGDERAAVRTAAGEMGIGEDADLAESLSIVLARGRAAAVVEDELPHVGALPASVLAVLHDWCLRRTPSPKPAAVTQAVLAIASMLAGRGYATPEGRALAVWLGVVDSSVGGLRPLRAIAESIALQRNEAGAMRTGVYTTSTQVMTSLLHSPRVLWVTDHIGTMVRKAPRQTSDAYAGAIGALQSTWDARTLLVDADVGKAGKPREVAERVILSPQLSVLALLSHDEIGILGSEYGRGVPQMLVVADAGATVHIEQAASMQLPDEVVAWASRLRSVADIPNEPPGAMRVVISDSARARLDEMRRAMVAAMEPAHLQGLRGLAHGYSETARRVACVLAVWSCPEEPIVDWTIADWCARWATRCLMEFGSRLAVAPRDDDRDVASAIEYLLHDQPDGLTAREITHRCRMFKRLTPTQRQAVLLDLVSEGRLERVDRGRSQAYCVRTDPGADR